MFEIIPSIQTSGQEYLPFEMGYLPELFQKKAVAELHETPENHSEKLNEMKMLLKGDKLTKDLIFFDEYLIMYLRNRKHNAEKAFLQAKSYVVMRKKNPKMFVGLNFDSIVHTIENEVIYILPWRCQDGCAIMVIELDNWDPDKFPVEEVKRAIVTYMLGSLKDPMTQVNGLKLIFDVQSNPIKHLRHATPNNMHLIYHGAQKVCPMRYKEVHIINDSVVFKAAYAIIKHFLSEKIKSRIIFHNDSTTLLKHFPRSILPKKFGGELENYAMTDWLKRSLTPEQVISMTGIKNWPPTK